MNVVTKKPHYDSMSPRRLIIDELQELVKFNHLVKHLIIRNVTSRYKRSILGIGWTLLDPLMTMLVMAIIYAALFKSTIEDFPVFLLSGIIVWTFFSQASSQAIMDLLLSGGLIGRLRIPKSVFAVAAVGTSLVNLLFSIGPLALVMFIFGRPFTPALLFLPVSLIVISGITLGVGLFVSSFSVFFADIVNIYNFILRLGMFVSGVFYPLDLLPEDLQYIVRLIPTYHMVILFRDPVYVGTLPEIGSILYAILWMCLSIFFGFWVFSRFSDAYAYRL